MIVKDGWNNFIEEVMTSEKPIVCFGAGAIADFIENLFIEHDIWPRIRCFLDNNPEKSGRMVGDSRAIPIETIEQFREKQISEFILLIVIESYVTIEQQFSQYLEWKNISSYAYVKLNREYQQMIQRPYEILGRRQVTRIPKVIHYCWFGRGEKSELHQMCLDSWRRYCPDYQIVEWNEDNYDVSKTLYMRQAYEAGKWAYVTDYARIDILYNYGGIYLDLDVELIREPDALLMEEAFIAHGQWPAVNSGAGLGAVRENKILKEMLNDERARAPFVQKDGYMNMTQNGYYESKTLRRYGYKHPFLMRQLDGMLVLAPEIMATASVLGERIFVTDRTIAIHHCGGSWASQESINERMQTLRGTSRNEDVDRD